jgi:hypothetical protein
MAVLESAQIPLGWRGQTLDRDQCAAAKCDQQGTRERPKCRGVSFLRSFLRYLFRPCSWKAR